MDIRANQKRFLMALIAVAVINTWGCKKYEEGPLISLRTKKARLSGDWDVKSLTKNGEDLMVIRQATEIAGTRITTQNNYSLILEFDKDGDFREICFSNVSYQISDYGYYYENSNSFGEVNNGEWEWEDNKESLELKTVSSGSNLTIIVPYDDGVFYGAKEDSGISVVSPV